MSPMIKEKNLPEKEAEKMLKKGIESLNIIKISPYHIILKEFHSDFSLRKLEWNLN